MCDDVMLRVYYIYFDILNDDVTVLHKKPYSYINCQYSLIHYHIIFNISSTCHSFYKGRHKMYFYKLRNV